MHPAESLTASENALRFYVRNLRRRYFSKWEQYITMKRAGEEALRLAHQRATLFYVQRCLRKALRAWEVYVYEVVPGLERDGLEHMQRAYLQTAFRHLRNTYLRREELWQRAEEWYKLSREPLLLNILIVWRAAAADQRARLLAESSAAFSYRHLLLLCFRHWHARSIQLQRAIFDSQYLTERIETSLLQRALSATFDAFVSRRAQRQAVEAAMQSYAKRRKAHLLEYVLKQMLDTINRADTGRADEVARKARAEYLKTLETSRMSRLRPTLPEVPPIQTTSVVEPVQVLKQDARREGPPIPQKRARPAPRGLQKPVVPPEDISIRSQSVSISEPTVDPSPLTEHEVALLDECMDEYVAVSRQIDELKGEIRALQTKHAEVMVLMETTQYPHAVSLELHTIEYALKDKEALLQERKEREMGLAKILEKYKKDLLE
ncbi:hypothetical protein GMRT_15325 [Giardia muris]|uniref:Uncharacterized protein n=1 Tax=Giardia muris TaxID=5742 RepID=A0A4Z1SSK5_GIAMU|nr:hypothetical protein GMRT_15325 [Giardia muris]|eukprot:TNJ28906.1 hypothetical protein GMRT_15325 [Giardia muris]